MTVSFRALGSGQVDYHSDRPVFHFATPPAVIEARIAADRLRARGFIMSAKEVQE